MSEYLEAAVLEGAAIAKRAYIEARLGVWVRLQMVLFDTAFDLA